MSAYKVVDVESWEDLGREPMGSKPRKQWLRDPDNQQKKWLFKPVTWQGQGEGRFLKGDDWSEKVSTELASVLHIPAATVELAVCGGNPGIISLDVSDGRDLAPGNVVLYVRDKNYDLTKEHGVPGYNVTAIFDALMPLGAAAPAGWEWWGDAKAVFATYLGLDALVGNTDRHHENWGVLVYAEEREGRLAPTFDHASSLGFLLPQSQFEERTQTKDVRRSVEHYARGGKSRHVDGRPSLLDVALEAFSKVPNSVPSTFSRHLEDLSEDHIEALVSRVPGQRMSHPCRIFVTRMIMENRRRLLDGLNNR